MTRVEVVPDTERIISDDEDEELRQLMREGTEDVLMPSEFTSAVQSFKSGSAASLTKTPHMPKSRTQVLLTFFESIDSFG